MTPRFAHGLLLLAGAIWGLGFIAQKTAMDHIDPLLFIGLRFTLAGLAVAPLIAFERRRTPERLSRKSLTRFCILGGVFFIGMTLQQIGLLTSTVTNAGFLTTLYVVIVPLILLFVLRTPQPVWIWPAAFTSVLGVYLLSSGGAATYAWGDAWILAGAAVWAVHVILVSHFSRETRRPVTMACTQFFVCGLLGLAVYAIQFATGYIGRDLTPQSVWDAMPAVLYAGVFSGGIAFTLQAIGQRVAEASVASILMASESLFAALLGAIVLGERLALPGYAGCGLIFAAIVIVESKQRRAEASQNAA